MKSAAADLEEEDSQSHSKEKVLWIWPEVSTEMDISKLGVLIESQKIFICRRNL